MSKIHVFDKDGKEIVPALEVDLAAKADEVQPFFQGKPPSNSIMVDSEVMEISNVAKPGYQRLIFIDAFGKKYTGLYVKRNTGKQRKKGK